MKDPIYIMENQEQGSPVFIDADGDNLIVEVRAYSPAGGCWRGEVWQTIPRTEAVRMARAILEWAEGKE